MADARNSGHSHSSRSSDPFSFSLAMSARLRACVLVLGMAYTCLRADGAVSWDSFEVSMRYGGCPHAEWAACMCVATPRGEVCHSVADRHTQTTRLTTLNELVRDAGPCHAPRSHNTGLSRRWLPSPRASPHCPRVTMKLRTARTGAHVYDDLRPIDVRAGNLEWAPLSRPSVFHCGAPRLLQAPGLPRNGARGRLKKRRQTETKRERGRGREGEGKGERRLGLDTCKATGGLRPRGLQACVACAPRIRMLPRPGRPSRTGSPSL